MRRAITCFFSIIFFVSTAGAQEINIEKVFGGYRFIQDNTTLKSSDLLRILKPNKEAYDLMMTSKERRDGSNVLGFIGGGLIGWPLGTALGQGEPNWKLAGIGLGFVIVAIPISKSANRKSKEAVMLHNSNLDLNSMNTQKPKFDIGLNTNGIGLCLKF